MLDELKSAARKVNGARHLRGLLIDCRRLLSERGEANSVVIARDLVERFHELPDDAQADFFERLSRDFSPDPKAVLQSAQAYAEMPSAANLQRLTQTAEPPRQELLRRINRTPGGTGSIVAMRRALLARMNKQPELQAVEADFLHLLSSWFNPGFLQLKRVDWNSPAQLLEQIIRHEAVHQIDGWDDLRRRLQPDRRCFAFFHPQLPDEPLIFVEVALIDHMADSITPLLDEEAAAADLDKATWAIFYSISNTQSGLRGVSFGDSLIKRVVETLNAEFPRLRHYSTLSPIPGLRKWLAQNAQRLLELTPEKDQAELGRAAGFEPPTAAHLLQALEHVTSLDPRSPLQRWLLRCAAQYLGQELSDGKPVDPVARFHLGNGARVERLNWLGDPSPKGLQQSYGLMVNYLYDLKRLDRNRAQLADGKIAVAGAIEELLF